MLTEVNLSFVQCVHTLLCQLGTFIFPITKSEGIICMCVYIYIYIEMTVFHPDDII